MFVAAGQNKLSRKYQQVAHCPDGTKINKTTNIFIPQESGSDGAKQKIELFTVSLILKLLCML